MKDFSDETTTLARGKQYISKKGAEFTIEFDPNGHALYKVTMLHGGKPPQLCDARFTSFRQAERALIDYLENHSNISLDLAEYPGKVKRGKSQNE